MYIYMCVYVYVYVYLYIHICIYVCIYENIHIWFFMHLYIFIHPQAYKTHVDIIFIHMYNYMHYVLQTVFKIKLSFLSIAHSFGMEFLINSAMFKGLLCVNHHHSITPSTLLFVGYREMGGICAIITRYICSPESQQSVGLTVYACIHMHMYVYGHICKYIHICIYIHIMYVHVCIYIYI